MALTLYCTSVVAFAQEPATSPVTDPAANGMLAIPAGTQVTIEITEPLSSSTRKRGDMFKLALAEPLVLDGSELLPAGTTGSGEIVHAASARGGGAPGELLIAARTLDGPNGTVLLRGFKLGATGEDNSGMALGVSIAAGPFAMFIRGREIEIPAGTRGFAKVKAAVAVATPALPDTPAPTAEESQQPDVSTNQPKE